MPDTQAWYPLVKKDSLTDGEHRSPPIAIEEHDYTFDTPNLPVRFAVVISGAQHLRQWSLLGIAATPKGFENHVCHEVAERRNASSGIFRALGSGSRPVRVGEGTADRRTLGGFVSGRPPRDAVLRPGQQLDDVAPEVDVARVGMLAGRRAPDELLQRHTERLFGRGRAQRHRR